MTVLVGYTGFVGSNIYASGGCDVAYNSQNIREAYKTNPEILIYAGVRAEKYLANKEPEKDREQIRQAKENMIQINPRKIVLISTIDVFRSPVNVDESSEPDTNGLHPYGMNRYHLEKWVAENFKESFIIRLPALFGKNIKKNFIYDYIHRIPTMLTSQKLEELSLIEPDLRTYYTPYDSDFYKVIPSTAQEEKLKEIFQRLGFSALDFTDSRSTFQFYNLARLQKDIQTVLKNKIPLWHAATEPVSAGDIYMYLSGVPVTYIKHGTPVHYDYRTQYAELFGGKENYIEGRQQVLAQLKSFVEVQQRNAKG